jgi:hypothetical protein
LAGDAGEAKIARFGLICPLQFQNRIAPLARRFKAFKSFQQFQSFQTFQFGGAGGGDPKFAAKDWQTSQVIGLISDTHGLVRPQALDALRGVDLIIHAGDIGKAEVLDALKPIAPLHAIRGNSDRGAWAKKLPDTMTSRSAE